MAQARNGFYSEKVKRESYLATISDPDYIHGQHRKITDILKDGPLSRAQISEKTKIALHIVCARVNELMKSDFLIQTQKKTMNNSTNKNNSVLKLNPLKFEGQKELF